MIATSMSEIANQIGAVMLGQDSEIDSVFIDSRQDAPKGLFIALKGPHFDAHKFVSDVVNSGAKGVVVDHRCETEGPQLVVNNTRLALAEIARLNRNKSTAKYIAITGSSGKTTVKEMVASILQLSGKTFATKGNLNNDIGVPLTLLGIDADVKYGVVELGANHIGEVAYTADITRPDVALVNNVSAAHLEGFGDLHGVATAKREIYSALSDEGVAILNKDDSFYTFFQQKTGVNILTYSVNGAADVTARNISVNHSQSPCFELNYQNEKIQVDLPIIGLHNVSNALAAASCCIAIGISLSQIANGLKKTPEVSGRLVINQLESGCQIIDDTYNANVASMKAAIDLLKNYPSPRILVLGDMAELGELGRQCHEQVGEYARESKIDKLFSCGVLTQFSQMAFDDGKNSNGNEIPSASISERHFTHQKELVKKLKKEAISCATILVKGSRSAHMENIVQALLENSKSDKSNKNYSERTETSAASLKGRN